MDASMLAVVIASLGATFTGETTREHVASAPARKVYLAREAPPTPRGAHTVRKQYPGAAGRYQNQPARTPAAVVPEVGAALRDTTGALVTGTRNTLQEVGDRLTGAADELTGGTLGRVSESFQNAVRPPLDAGQRQLQSFGNATNNVVQNTRQQLDSAGQFLSGNQFDGSGDVLPAGAPQGNRRMAPRVAAAPDVVPPQSSAAQDPGQNPFSGGPRLTSPARTDPNGMQSVLVPSSENRPRATTPSQPDNSAWADNSAWNNAPPRNTGAQRAQDSGNSWSTGSPQTSESLQPVRPVDNRSTGQNPPAPWPADSWRRDTNTDRYAGAAAGSGSGTPAGDPGNGWPTTNAAANNPSASDPWASWQTASNPSGTQTTQPPAGSNPGSQPGAGAVGQLPSTGAGTNPAWGTTSATGWPAQTTPAGLPPGANPASPSQPIVGNANFPNANGQPPGAANGQLPNQPESLGSLLLVSLGLIGSLGANLFLGFSYMDARHRYLSALRRATRFGTRRE